MKFFKTRKAERITEQRQGSEERLRVFSGQDKEEILEELSTRELGLTYIEVEERLERDGLNEIIVENHNTKWTRLRNAVINPFNIVLFVIALITFFTDIVFSDSHDYITITIIGVLIFVSSLIAFVQGERSNNAAEELTKMISNKTHVFRDGSLIEIPIEEIVVGDIVQMSAGDMFPADVLFLSTKDAFIAQAALTGESQPVEKYSDYRQSDGESITDLSNIGFMGTNMVSGSANVLVLATGNDTYFGSMAKTLSGDKAQNSFERGVSSVSRMLIGFMVAAVPLVFIINGITKGNWIDSLLFAITIAVGLTPEMLPVIMTSTLAKGAIEMHKHKVIVKQLGGIQTFGEMDILCTDKTGTLTEDKIILEKYMNLYGEDDTRVLRHAYLNSYFQTGLKNLIDLAVINRAEENGLEPILDNYEIIDEIPFDFSRRRMSVVFKDKTGKRQLITKGAVEEMMENCSFVEYDGEVIPLDEKSKKRAMDVYLKYNNDGLRMIAVAQKNEIAGIDEFSVEHETGMVLIGFIGFLDPPKESAKEAISALNNHGVRVVVLTGDSEGVAQKVCSKVGVDTSESLTGADVERMDDIELAQKVEICNLFSKLSPAQKQRVVTIMQGNGHTVGYLGDGINDAPPLQQADVGISVDSAVDIAKETADIILLEKDLLVLEEGVIEGRKTFGNIMKYIKMATSGNFGNVFSVIVSSIFLPFLPMIPIQILTQNLLCDFSQFGIPFDSVDEEYVRKPRKWDTKSIRRYMLVMGPLSSIFDVLLFAVMWFVVGANTKEMAPLFQAGWFVFGTVSQTLIIHFIRTAKIPFLQSRASTPFALSTIIVAAITFIIGFSGLATLLLMSPLSASVAPWIILLLAGYFVSAEIMKRVYIKYFGEWL